MSQIAASSAILTGLCSGNSVTAVPSRMRLVALRRRGQHHQRVGKDRKAAAEMQFAEPHRVEPDPVAELDLRQDVVVALLLGKPGRARQLVEEPEAHAVHPRFV